MTLPSTDSIYGDENITRNFLTGDDLVSQDPEAFDDPNPSQEDAYDIESRQTDGFAAQTTPAHKPSYPEVGYDPYANGGAPSQTFLENQA